MGKHKKNTEKEPWEPKMFSVDSALIKEACQFLSDLIKIDTTNYGDGKGNEIEAAKFCKNALEVEGFDNCFITEGAPGRGSIVCTWNGSDPDAKKVLLLAHLDIVPADPANWERNPLCGDIDGDYVWGRGALDCKGMVAAETMAAITLKREGFQPKGDIILAFTADEESGGELGLGHLVRNHFEKIKADYIINEGGGILLPIGKDPKHYIVQTGEKGVFWTKIRVKGKGGHGSVPIKKKDNAIYKISKITQKIIEYKYPIEIIPAVKEMVEKLPLPGIVKKLLISKRLVRPLIKLADKATGQPISSNMFPFIMDIINPTGLKGSEKVNNIPRYAEMTFDCRLLYGHNRDNVKKYFRKAVGKKLYKEIEFIPIEPTQIATISSSNNPFWEITERIMNEMHEDATLVPMISAGSTDSKFLREKGIYVLGHYPMRLDPNITYAEMGELVHGKNERMWIPNLAYGMEFFYRLIKNF